MFTDVEFEALGGIDMRIIPEAHDSPGKEGMFFDQSCKYEALAEREPDTSVDWYWAEAFEIEAERH
ncbi:hypothetical protein BWI97_26285 [Siphonobacter sp. BAB-5405]|nr:hypothetical protein BWI97_26285 [Siphonobacter sp. BAB-5405]